MNRFRPNIVVAGAAAWEEDSWHRFSLGSATFSSVKPCDRCKVRPSPNARLEANCGVLA